MHQPLIPPSRRPLTRWFTLVAIAVAAGVTWFSGQSQAATVVAPAGVQVEVVGTGRPVLMIPGLASSASEVWRETCAALQPGVQCHLMQLPGFAGAPAALQEGSTQASTQALFAQQYAGLPKPADIQMSAQGYHFLMWDDADWLAAQLRRALGQ